MATSQFSPALPWSHAGMGEGWKSAARAADGTASRRAKEAIKRPKLFIGRAPGPPEIQRSGSSKREPAAAKGRTARNRAIRANPKSRRHNSEARPEKQNDDQLHPSARGWARSFCSHRKRCRSQCEPEQTGSHLIHGAGRPAIPYRGHRDIRKEGCSPGDLQAAPLICVFEVGGALPC